MCSAYKLNKQGDNIQPWRTPFQTLNQSVVPCPILTVASWPAYRFLRRQVRWSGTHISWRILQFVVIHTIKGFSIVNEADVFLKFSSFLYDPMDVDNLVSGSSTFSKSTLYILKFSVHILLKPSLKDFEHYIASVWNECNCVQSSSVATGLEKGPFSFYSQRKAMSKNVQTTTQLYSFHMLAR